LDPKNRKQQIQHLIDQLRKSGSTEFDNIKQLLVLKFEEAKHRLIDAAGDDVHRFQGEAKAWDKLYRELMASVTLQQGDDS
jgi:hypothetical protein